MTTPAPRNHPAKDAHPAPTPAPVAVSEDRATAFGRAAEMLRADTLVSAEVRSAVAKWLEAVATVWAGAEQHHDYDDGPIEFEETIDGLAQDVTDAILTPRPEPVVPCVGHATCNALVHEHGCYNDYGSCESPEEHRPEPVVAPQNAELCGPCRRGQIGACDGNEYVKCRSAKVASSPVVAPLPSEAVWLALADMKAQHRAVTDSRGEVKSCTCRMQFGVQHPENEGYESHLLDMLTAAVCRLVPEDDEDTVRVPRSAVELLRVGMSAEGSTTDLHVAAGVILRAVDGAR